MRETLTSDWFARLDLLLVIASGTAWLFFPDYAGASPLLLLLLPWVLRLVGGQIPFRRTKLDWLMLIFLVTTWVGYWASYDKSGALNKAWLITASVFLYYALSAQPEQNITWITNGLFMIGVGVSVYFFITYDFIETSRKIEVFNRFEVWWTGIRPPLPLPPIHPNYVSGVAALTGMFGFYPLQKSSRGKFVRLVILAGFFVIMLALVMATSRGVWMALASAAGIWLLWRLVNLNGINLRLGKEALFPILVLIYLCGVVAVLYAGPARLPSDFAGSTDFGTGSRAELFVRSLYFLGDYPITGGGLASFPGLYSQYILGIPYFYVINSHNLFLDVFIEQGIFGGAAFSLLYIFCIWQVSRAVAREMNIFRWLVLCALVVAVVHGMVDDYLYNGKSAFLSVFLAGVSMIAARNGQEAGTVVRWWNIGKTRQRFVYLLLVALAVFAGINYNRLCAVWYANLGAVQLAQVELAGFPETGWAGPAIAARIDQAGASLHTALEFDPLNRTANHRLGLISMLKRDYLSAVWHLCIAYERSPDHRGIAKSLGFGYAWLGDSENALSLLKNIPESKSEFGVYCYWWKEQGRDDLSEKASMMLEYLKSTQVQP